MILINIATGLLILGIILILLRFILRVGVGLAKFLLAAGVVLLVVALVLGMIGPLTP